MLPCSLESLEVRVLLQSPDLLPRSHPPPSVQGSGFTKDDDTRVWNGNTQINAIAFAILLCSKGWHCLI